MRKFYVILALPLVLFGAPKGFKSSCATLIQDGTKTMVKSGKSAIISWDDFSIGKGEHVHFLQSSHKSKVLNRVTGNKLSEIHGTLESNGQVYLINPAGVHIGKSGRIDCAAFYASTLEMSDEDFLAGKLNTQGCVEGSIKCEGVIDASRIEEVDGKILLLAEETYVNGTLNAKTVHVLGDQVQLGEETRICAPGGEVLIGGDKQGQNPNIRNAMNVTMEKGSVVKADAGQKGNGGKVIYWSDQATAVAGFTSVRGGEEFGDGGFVEASGAEVLEYTGRSDRRAPNGRCGQILLDPSNINITSVPPTDGAFVGTSPIKFYPSLASSDILNTDLEAELAMGDVLINTAFGAFASAGELTVVAGFTWGTYNTSLTLRADNNLTFASSPTITNTGSGLFRAVAGRFLNQVNGIIENTHTGSGNFEGIELSNLGTAAGSYPGVFIDGIVRSVEGNIVFSGIGRGGAGGIPFSKGVTVDNGQVSSTGTGVAAASITMVGTGGTLINDNDGVAIERQFMGLFPVVSTVDGDITLIGNAIASTFILNQAVSISNVGSVLSTGSGDVIMDGTVTGSPTGGANEGVIINSGATVALSGTGELFMTGVGGGIAGLENHGVHFAGSGFGGASMTSTASGDITIIGTGRALATLDSSGVALTRNAVLETDSGTIDITGVALGSGTEHHGVDVDSGVIRTNTYGTILIDGTATSSSTASDSSGVTVRSATAFILTNTGPMTISGTARAGGSTNYGISVTNAGTIESVSGATTLTGLGSDTGINDNSGIIITDVGSNITSMSGDITMTGTARTSGTDNHGIYFTSMGETSTSTGSITMTGMGSSSFYDVSHGIFIDSLGSAVTTAGSPYSSIEMTGTSGDFPDSYGINVSGSLTAITAGDSPITMTGMAPVTEKGILVSIASITNGNAPLTLRTLSDIDIDMGAMVTSAGDVLLDSCRDINVTGDVTSTTIASSGADVLMIADRDIALLPGSGTAVIDSATGNTTLVVDDSFPTAPGIGSGQFTIDPGVSLTAAAELRIYTARRSQNSINTTLNGTPFVEGPLFVDSSIETWATYYPDGSYGGLAFNIYYKDFPTPPPADEFTPVFVIGVQLENLLPVINLQPLWGSKNRTSNYHQKLGVVGFPGLDPAFEPYSAFIFESALFKTDRWYEKHFISVKDYLTDNADVFSDERMTDLLNLYGN